MSAWIWGHKGVKSSAQSLPKCPPYSPEGLVLAAAREAELRRRTGRNTLRAEHGHRHLECSLDYSGGQVGVRQLDAGKEAVSR